MKTLLKKLNYSDSEYRSAVNYKYSLYNFPITLNYKKNKYILSAGTSDKIVISKSDHFIYILSYNFGLSYSGLQIFDTINKEEVNNIFIDNLENSFFDMDNAKKLNQLLEYLYI